MIVEATKSRGASDCSEFKQHRMGKTEDWQRTTWNLHVIVALLQRLTVIRV